MKVKLVKIGNSMGIRLPKNVIQACGFQKEVNLNMQGGSVILTAPQQTRAAWFELFRDSVRQKPIRERGEWEW